MSAGQPVVLIAAPSFVVRKLKGGLDDRVEVVPAEAYDDALACLRERQVDLLVVCYVFDDVRPYRLLNHLQELDERPPAMLVRALPVPLQEREHEVRKAYELLGVRVFQNFSDQESSQGAEVALAQFRSHVSDLLRSAALSLHSPDLR